MTERAAAEGGGGSVDQVFVVEDWELPEKEWVLLRFPGGRTALVMRKSARTPEALEQACDAIWTTIGTIPGKRAKLSRAPARESARGGPTGARIPRQRAPEPRL